MVRLTTGEGSQSFFLVRKSVTKEFSYCISCIYLCLRLCLCPCLCLRSPALLDGVPSHQWIQHWVHTFFHILNQHTVAISNGTLDTIQISEQRKPDRKNDQACQFSLEIPYSVIVKLFYKRLPQFLIFFSHPFCPSLTHRRDSPSRVLIHLIP